MRRITLTAPVVSVLLLVLTGCGGASSVETCDEITRTVGKSVIVARDIILEPPSSTSLETAAAEIEGYVEPLRDLAPHGDLAEPHKMVVEGLDELLIAIRAGGTERIGDAADELAKTAVDVEIACR